MDTAVAVPGPRSGVAPTVSSCYDLLDVCAIGGVSDFTDGKYVDDRNDRAAYLAAQRRQAEYLLDEATCTAGTRLLDVGCGYGRILEHAGRRGADAVGITISPTQAARCRARGLVALERNYRDIPRHAPPDWLGAFDAVVANGSLEHFVQVSDAVAGHADAIYEEMFDICRRLLRPGGRFVTTAIHFREVDQVAPADLAASPYAHSPGSPLYHFAMVLERSFGGWYPEPGQLARCAAGSFDLVAEQDGTHDYHLTSEHWLRRLRWAIAANPRVWWHVFRKWRAAPTAAWEMLRCQLWDQSWAWQFRPPAPTRLLRQTWTARST